ncbi:MAG: polysaccharide export protein [Candidatus Omnitrophica bacterium]|nr:polysaccharide export protein [Candidatus Omnitrophota bacterium]
MRKLLRRYKLMAFCLALIVIPGPAQAKEDVLTPEEMERQQLLINQQVLQTYSEAGTQPIDGSILSLEVPSDSRYTLGVNDVIEVSVLRHPEVSGQYIVNQEGKMQFEFVGDIHIAGQTKDEVAQTLQDKLTEYIISPEVTVKIVGYNSKVVYVIGEVGQPGKIFMRGDTITVREALLQAGLPLLSAKVEKSKLFTPSAAGVPVQKRVDVKSLLYKGDLRENLVMKPGDTLFIPPTAMTKVMRTISPVAAPISTGAGMGRTVTTGF